MINGVEITVKRPSVVEYDRFNNAVYTSVEEAISNVLVAPGATEDLEASRPEGVTVSYTLHIPKTYTGDLEGCSVVLPAPWEGEYRVIGKPGAYIDANTPTMWHMPVEIEAAHG